MDALWFAPPAVLIAGAAAGAVLLRRVLAEVDELTASRRDVERLQAALVPVKARVERVRTSIDRVDRR